MKTRWVTPKEAADGAGVNEKTVRRWCIAGVVRCKLTPSGSRWRVAIDEDGMPVRA